MNGHGARDSFMDFHCQTSNKLHNISQDSQIIIHACGTACGVVSQSVAYKIAQDNNCEVFAAKDSINRMKFRIKTDSNTNPKVDKIAAYVYLKPVTTCKIRGFQ